MLVSHTSQKAGPCYKLEGTNVPKVSPLFQPYHIISEKKGWHKEIFVWIIWHYVRLQFHINSLSLWLT